MHERTPRILLVDDEQSIQTLLSFPLRKDGYEVVQATDGREALARFGETAFDLVVLDVMLPRLDGLEVCRRMRARSSVPIIMLTAKAEEIDKVLGLELGADDYITKPFSLRELLARVRAVLRRPGPRRKFEELAFGDVRVHRRGRRVTRAGREVRLTRKEYDLLVYLAAHPGDVVTRERLLDEVWGYERFPTTRTVDTHVLRLRRKLEADPDRPRFIHTVHGQGYRFVVP
jgi:DNA-binding response OmpR family regulator